MPSWYPTWGELCEKIDEINNVYCISNHRPVMIHIQAANLANFRAHHAQPSHETIQDRVRAAERFFEKYQDRPTSIEQMTADCLTELRQIAEKISMFRDPYDFWGSHIDSPLLAWYFRSGDVFVIESLTHLIGSHSASFHQAIGEGMQVIVKKRTKYGYRLKFGFDVVKGVLMLPTLSRSIV